MSGSKPGPRRHSNDVQRESAEGQPMFSNQGEDLASQDDWNEYLARATAQGISQFSTYQAPEDENDSLTYTSGTHSAAFLPYAGSPQTYFGFAGAVFAAPYPNPNHPYNASLQSFPAAFSFQSFYSPVQVASGAEPAGTTADKPSGFVNSKVHGQDPRPRSWAAVATSGTQATDNKDLSSSVGALRLTDSGAGSGNSRSNKPASGAAFNAAQDAMRNRNIPGAKAHPTTDTALLSAHVNPSDFDPSAVAGKFFVIKSYSEDDVHKAIKYGVWASTEVGNRRLDSAYRALHPNCDEPSYVHPGGATEAVYLFFSVNASGCFCGLAEMTSPVDYSKKFGIWAQDKWRGQFTVRWLFIKDIPNKEFKHIILPNNDKKPVTNSRDTQEVLPANAVDVLHVFVSYQHASSILDDFAFYDQRQAELEARRGTEQLRTQSPAKDAAPVNKKTPSSSPVPKDRTNGSTKVFGHGGSLSIHYASEGKKKGAGRKQNNRRLPVEEPETVAS